MRSTFGRVAGLAVRETFEASKDRHDGDDARRPFAVKTSAQHSSQKSPCASSSRDAVDGRLADHLVAERRTRRGHERRIKNRRRFRAVRRQFASRPCVYLAVARARAKQTTIEFRTWGGRRRGAGRKPKGEKAGVCHGARPELTGRHPLLVTLKVRREVWNLRARRAMAQILPALAAVLAKSGMRVVHTSVQRDHIHLVVEAEGKVALTRGMRGLCTSIAKRLNALMERKGKVLADRYHQRLLTTPRQVRSALRYVLSNARKHGVAPSDPRWLDPCSSAAAFDGWSIEVSSLARSALCPPISAPFTWLLKVGWRRAGPPLDPGERPGPLEK